MWQSQYVVVEIRLTKQFQDLKAAPLVMVIRIERVHAK
jgi:hypothetical protein